MRFRKKPVTPDDEVYLLAADQGWIETLEGGHVVSPGDWIIHGVAGEFYPCKPEIFAQSYEVYIPTTEEQIAEALEPDGDVPSGVIVSSSFCTAPSKGVIQIYGNVVQLHKEH